MDAFRVVVPQGLTNQDDISNQIFNLKDQEHLVKVKWYLYKNGGWILEAVPKDGSCLFRSLQNASQKHCHRKC